MSHWKSTFSHRGKNSASKIAASWSVGAVPSQRSAQLNGSSGWFAGLMGISRSATATLGSTQRTRSASMCSGLNTCVQSRGESALRAGRSTAAGGPGQHGTACNGFSGGAGTLAQGWRMVWAEGSEGCHCARATPIL